jgi:hypothetical protein
LKTRLIILMAIGATLLAACSSSSKSTTSSSGSTPKGTHNLVGTFMPTAGVCSSATGVPSGSYLEMLGGNGAVVKNSFGGCSNPAYTPIKPGTQGLVTGTYQPQPANAIFSPANFFGSNFSVNTASVDHQTNMPVPPPSIQSASGVLTGNLEAIQVAYNGAYFNQGSPKPGGGYPGATKPLSGTISCNGAFTMQWQSQIVGGSFNNFSGIWHITGTFTPSSGTAAAALGCS